MYLIKILAALFVLSATSLSSSSLIIRPHGGYGYSHSSGSGNNGAIHHVGARILLPATDFKRFGLEISHFDAECGEKFTSIGIILEQRMWNWFNNSIGTVGYFDFGDNSENIVGLMSNLGWEPNWEKQIKPFITYRSDVIFSNKITSIHSVSVGISFSI